jgi:hypothetical protein
MSKHKHIMILMPVFPMHDYMVWCCSEPLCDYKIRTRINKNENR